MRIIETLENQLHKEELKYKVYEAMKELYNFLLEFEKM